jgi:hypothetical protein
VNGIRLAASTLLAIAAFAALAPKANAQTAASGQLVGDINDPSAAAIPRAAVTVNETATEESRAVLPLLPPGSYGVAPWHKVSPPAKSTTSYTRSKSITTSNVPAVGGRGHLHDQFAAQCAVRDEAVLLIFLFSPAHIEQRSWRSEDRSSR